MGCLLHAGVYKDAELFYSDRLDHFDGNQFSVPWVYRNVFGLKPEKGQHFFLQTGGITSRADIYLNGHQVADNKTQAGAYGGRTYDITGLVAENNALVVKAHLTDYQYDFGVGFVDWNPSPPDNGTGVWRDIIIKQSGPVVLGPLRVITDVLEPFGSVATVTLKTTAQNLEDAEVTFAATGAVSLENGETPHAWSQTYTIGPKQTLEISMTATYQNPAIWWPKQWGKQSLYVAQISAAIDQALSDQTEERKFGFRTVSSVLNADNDTQFLVNGQPFQVLGGGYSADMFLRFDPDEFTIHAKYMLDMGLNTVRLEGKMEQPELYDIADSLGLMVMAGWECCDKYESWEYNDNIANPLTVWKGDDYDVGGTQMLHEATMMQSHPSMLSFLVGSDYWPDDKATKIYMDAIKAAELNISILSSASKRSFPAALGPSGLKMEGPYDWVPPNYWYDTEPSEDRLGSAFGFGSELGAGVGTPEIGSLKKFLTQEDMKDLWTKPDKGLYHMSTKVSSFYDRSIYNGNIWKRYGAPTSLDDYLLKAQMADYEATRAQYEGFASMWSAKRPATGLIYWMLNNAWPSLHWNQYDYYMHPGGSFFGTKVGSRVEHVAYDYVKKSIWLINRSATATSDAARDVTVELLGLDGKVITSNKITVKSQPNSSKNIGAVKGIEKIKDVALLRLVISDATNKTISRNVYWLPKTIDTLDWDNSSWYHTPVTKFADYTALNKLRPAELVVTTKDCGAPGGGRTVVLENRSDVPAIFIRLNLVTRDGQDITPVYWTDNYVTLWPRETLKVKVNAGDLTGAVQISGKNVKSAVVSL